MTLADLDAELIASGCNKNDRAFILLQACLDEGSCAGSELRKKLGELGFDRTHVRIMLEKNAGTSPKWSKWQQLADDWYLAHP